MGARKRGGKGGCVVCCCWMQRSQWPDTQGRRKGEEKETMREIWQAEKNLGSQERSKNRVDFFIVMYLLRRGGRIVSSTTSVVLLQRRLCAKTHRWWGGVCSSRVLCEYADTMCVPRMCAKKQAWKRGPPLPPISFKSDELLRRRKKKRSLWEKRERKRRGDRMDRGRSKKSLSEASGGRSKNPFLAPFPSSEWIEVFERFFQLSFFWWHSITWKPGRKSWKFLGLLEIGHVPRFLSLFLLIFSFLRRDCACSIGRIVRRRRRRRRKRGARGDKNP